MNIKQHSNTKNSKLLFSIYQEKKRAVAVLEKMMETSGVSGEGISPDVEDGELLDELKPHFRNGLHLSEKRLAVGTIICL